VAVRRAASAPPLAPADMAHAAPIVTLSRVAKVYSNGVIALRGLDLVVREREFVSLLGPSGCGKSTVLRLIAGLGELTAGRVDWPDAPGDRAGHRRDIGFVFQEPTLMPWATVFDNIRVPLRLAGAPRAAVAARVREAVAMVHLDGFENAYPRELSGGMKMRVSIARALVTRPRVLLMDEPFAALDEITRFKLNNDLLELWQSQHLTVIFVTHSVFESVYLSSRIVVMAARPGRVIDELRIEAGYPRDDSFRVSPVYHEHCNRVSRSLHEAIRA
jgi:NitT/TauT family transport system ATP-binding protein